MTIYKVRMYVNRHKRGGEIKREQYEEIIIIDNFETAHWQYEELRNKFEYSTQFSNRSGAVELFVPHMFDNGLLAYWPDHKEYIERVEANI